VTQTEDLSRWERIPEEQYILETAETLKSNGINVIITENGEEALKKVLELIPVGSEVYTTTSTTTEQIGLSKEIDESGRYVSLRKQITSADQPERRRALRRSASLAEYVVGSVHAVTKDGKVVAASQSGSQLGSYASGATKVIWVVGAQKIVDNLADAFLRIEQHSFPLEDARMKRTYGPQSSSGLNKMLVVNREATPDRITIVLVKERLGF